MKGNQTLSLSPSGGENVASHRCMITQLKHIFERLTFQSRLFSVKWQHIIQQPFLLNALRLK